MKLAFDKYSGCGNDFIIIDNREGVFQQRWVAPLCRRTNVGADGVLLVEESSLADAKMRIFNADGSEAEMCGNGLRCFIDYCCRRALLPTACSVETGAGVLKGWQQEGSVKCSMPPASGIKRGLSMNIHGKDWSFTTLNTGVPHAIAFVEELESCDLAALGPEVRYAPQFQPAGTNVSLAKRSSPGTLLLRTYERGVEAETESCGTAAAAAALAAHLEFALPSPITVKTRNGCQLLIEFSDNFNQIAMSGPAMWIYSGITSEFLLY